MSCKSLPERTFFALQLICIMYAGFKRIEPGMDRGGYEPIHLYIGTEEWDEYPAQGDLSRRLAPLKFRHYGYLGFLTVASLWSSELGFKPAHL